MFNGGTFPTDDQFTDVYLFKFDEYLKGKIREGKLSNSSVYYYYKILRPVLGLVEDLPSKNFGTILKARKTNQSIFTWLTEKELKQLENVPTRDRKEKYVKVTFLIGAYTGARMSDFITFDSNNISNGMIHYVTKKTGVSISVPVKPIVRKLLATFLGLKDEVVSRGYYNKKIKNLGMRAKIHKKIKIKRCSTDHIGCKYQFIESHTARRSFATNLYLRGADILEISRLLGHKDIHMTQNYIVCGYKEYSKKVMSFFDD